jgi:aminomethyltransferase
MHTSLLEAHRALGGKIVDFYGWQMPVQYKGVIHEHLAVRSKVGIFDVSHMGRIVIEGLEAESLLDYLSTNHIADKQDGSATYTVWCDEKGMVVDDLIVYKESDTRFFVIVNAGNREKDLAHLLHYSGGRDVNIYDHYHEDGILAVQGPKAMELVSSLFPDAADLEPMHFISVPYGGQEIIISRTGYTGETGVEIIAPNALVVRLWKLFLDKGRAFGIEPIGLAARDTLRLEMGYALYGHELSNSIMPIESVSAWTIKWDKPDFLGKKALESMRKANHYRHEYGIVLVDKGIAREGCPVFQKGRQIGIVTSGTFSPSLKVSIAIILVENKLTEGDSVDIQIRRNFCTGHVVRLPFYSQHT